MSVLPIADDPEEELRIIRAWGNTWDAAERRVARWPQGTPELIGRWAEDAPWVDPEAATSLAQAGIDPRSPAGREASRAAGYDYTQGWRQGREPGEPPTISRRRRGTGSFWSNTSSYGTGQANAARVALSNETVKAALGRTPVEDVMYGDISAAELVAQSGASWDEIVELHNNVVAMRREMADTFGDDWLNGHLTRGARSPLTGDEEDRPDRRAILEGRIDPEDLTAEALDATLPIARKAPNRPGGFRIPGTELRVRPPDINLPDFEGIPVPFTNVDDEVREAGLGFESPGGEALRGAFRGGFMALNAPIQETIGQFRAAVGRVRDEGWDALLDVDPPAATFSRLQSDAGIALESLTAGEEVDVGTGFFVNPESQVGRTRLRRERSHGLIGGHVITPGRWAVDAFTGLDPGDTGYGFASGLVDLAVNLGMDPTNWVGAPIVRQARVADNFTRAGSLGDEVAEVVEGVSRFDLAQAAAERGDTRIWPRTRNTSEEAAGLFPAALQPDLDPNTVSGWLLAGDGRRVVEAIAAETDPYSLWKGTKGKLDPETLRVLVGTTDADEVTRVLFDRLSLRGDRNFAYNPPAVSRHTWTRRAFSDLPVTQVRTDDPAQFLTGLEAMLINGRVPQERIAARFRDAINARNPIDRVDVFEDALDDIAEVLVARGVDEVSARAVTGHIKDYAAQDRAFNTVDGFNAGALPEHQRVGPNGEIVAIPRAHLASEMAPDVLNVPNIREIKRLTSLHQRLAPLFISDTGEWANAGQLAAAIEAASGTWKRLTLLRIAWPVRQVLIDEQLRMAAAGLPSLWKSPVHLLAAVMFDNKTDELLMELLDAPNGSFRMYDEFNRALLQGGVYDPVDIKRAGLGAWGVTERGDARFVGHWGRELGQLSADPVASRLAGGHSVDSVVEAMMRGDLADHRASIGRRRLTESMADEVGVRGYVESIWNRLRHKTGEDPDVMEAVSRGYFQGEGRPLYFSEPGRLEPTEGFEAALARFEDSAPAAVKGERDASGVVGIAGRFESATNRLFYLLGSMPSNKLSRAPAWRWYYFESLAERMPMLTAEAQEAIIEQAAQYRIAAGWSFNVGPVQIGSGDDLLQRLKAARFDAKGNRVTGTHSLEDASIFGRVEAMERTKRLLGDLTTKNQTLDALRVITPFGAAWREAMASYARLIKENPLIVYNVSKGVEGAMDSGFFYRDENGELVFAYPGAAQLMSMIPGADAAPFPMTGRVQGLTMGFEVLPGLGPVATFPLASILPDTPSWDGARELIIPYGTETGMQFLVPEWAEKWTIAMRNTQSEGLVGGVLESIGKFLGGDTRESAAMWESSVNDVAVYLGATGDYDLSDQREIDRMFDDARKRAAHLWFWRGLAQSIVPSAPRPNPIFTDASGDTIMVSAMMDKLIEFREDDPLNATRRFLDEYGEMAFMLLSPKTDGNALYVPYDEEGYDWVRDNRELVDRYPEIGALFAPRGGGPAGITAYLRRVESGEIEAVDPAVRLARGQDSLASTLYDEARQGAIEAAREAGYEGALPEQLQDYLREYREYLFDNYPGYMREGRTLRDIQRTISDLEAAVSAESTFRESDAGVALNLYLRAREDALADLRAVSDADSLAGTTAAPLRDWLRAYGEQLVGSHPDFINLWERVFSREVELQDEP